MAGNFVKHLDLALSFTPDQPQRIEINTAGATDIGLNMAKRAADPNLRAPEAKVAELKPKPAAVPVYNFH